MGSGLSLTVQGLGYGDTSALLKKSTQALPAPRGWACSLGRTPFPSFGLFRAQILGGAPEKKIN